MLFGGNTKYMLISEIFSSIDGEGSRAGYLATFIRTIGCPLRCSYCDTKYAFEPDDTTKDMTIDEIVDTCKNLGNFRITLTGGEPLIQKDINSLLESLILNHFEVNIETSGSIYFDMNKASKVINDAYSQGKLFFTYDYKCPSSGMTDRMKPEIFENLGNNDIVKFVVGSEEDLNCMKQIVTDLENKYVYTQPNYFVSPVFGNIEPSEIVDYLKKNNLQNVRLQLQIHKIIWDKNKRGV